MEEFFEKIETLSNSLKKYEKNKEKLMMKMGMIESDVSVIIFNKKMSEICEEIDKISEKIDELQNEIDKGEIIKDDMMKRRMSAYEKKKIIDKLFLPFYLIYNLMNE